jgi:1-acyl-sn-glycerol-3-phosphate acyltransferase
MFLRVLHTAFLYLLTVISFFVGTAITLCFVPFSRDKIRTYQSAAHLWARFLVFFSGVKVTTQGLENIPRDQPSILVSNHQGAADIPVLLAFLPIRFRFAIKKELFSIPFFGWYLKKAGYFSVDREVVLSAYKTLETIVEILKTGESVLIFPEGTRSRDGSLGKLKRGSLMAALNSGAPIIPIAISGSFNVMPRGSKLFRPAKVKLTAGKPIYIKSEEEYDHKVEEVRDAIAKML